MKFSILATDRLFGKVYKVHGVWINPAGEITHVNIESNKSNTTWESVKNFHLEWNITDEELEVHIGGGSTGL